MAAHQKEKQATQQDAQESQDLNAAIGKNVLGSLGRPRELQRLQVRRLWEDHYRVNVFLGGDLASAKVAHSYFLQTDAHGGIVVSVPEIVKQY